MAFPWDVTAFLLVFVIVVIVLVRMSMRARAAAAQQEMSTESPHDKMLLKFVQDENGTRLGETVAVEGETMIVKTPRGFLAVPAASLTESEGGLKMTGPLDEGSARREGEAWREKSHKVITYEPKELPPEDRPET